MLADSELLRRGPELLDPFDPELVNPCSIDFRLGALIKYSSYDVEKCPSGLMLSHRPFLDKTWNTMEQGPFQLDPGEFVLGETYESITVPHDLAVDMLLKSSRAREGFDHGHAFHFDPGWIGIGTLEIVNLGTQPLMMGFKQKFGQLRFFPLTGKVLKPYNGKYQYSHKVLTSLADGNDIPDRQSEKS